MILLRMRMKNFFRYYGEQTINFVHEEEKNVTVIKGENGFGKTTLLSAFFWCFYGEVEKPLLVEKMYNKKARSELKEGDRDTAFVEIEFLDKNSIYTIYRGRPFKYQSGEMIYAGEEELEVTYRDKIGNSKKVIDPRSFFNNIIPVNLRKFFFFDGERINRLAQEEGREEIKSAILNILGLNVIENLRKDLESVDKELNKSLKKYLKGKDADLTDKKDTLIDEKHIHEQNIEALTEQKVDQELLIDDISKYLINHNSEMISAFEKERKQLDYDIQSIEHDVKDLKKRINKHISNNSKEMLVSYYTGDIYKMLEEKRVKGELPSDIKDTFIKDLIDRGSCICGTKIVDGRPEYFRLIELLKTAGKKELDDAYIKIVSYINDIKDSEKKYFSGLNDLIELEEAKYQENQRKINRIKEIDNNIEGIDIEEIAQKIEMRKVVERRLIDTKTDINRCKDRIKEIDKEIERVSAEIQKAELKNIEALKINSQINKVRQLISINNQVDEAFKEEVRLNLDKRIKEVFKSISHKEYREPVLTEELALKVVNNFNTKLEEEVLSTGESQVSSLSFIGALVSYSRDKQDSELYSSFMGGDFPIVMDSPFGNLDSVHSAQIAKGIGFLSNQVVVILSKKQWSNEVADNIYDRIGKMYELVEGSMDNSSVGESTYVVEVKI